MLGEITFVELPAIGKEFDVHDEMAVVESSKAASDVYCPVAGKVVEINSELESSPELINENCYEKGWICKLQITASDPAGGMMDAKKYEEYLKEL